MFSNEAKSQLLPNKTYFFREFNVLNQNVCVREREKNKAAQLENWIKLKTIELNLAYLIEHINSLSWSSSLRQSNFN